MREWRVERTSTIPAAPAAVWRRVVTPDGINDELRPWLTMSVPRGAETVTIDTVPVGRSLGRSWLRPFGVLPIDYDELTIVELEPGRRFREDSTMLSMRRWGHERTVEPAPGGGTVITDRLTMQPRLPLVWAGPLLRLVIAALFRHRHRRLARHRD